ncbi:MAG: nitroreductase family protein [Sedimentibacter sp.]
MKLQKSVIEIIKMRSSCRTFDSKDIDDDILQKLKDYIDEINNESTIKARFLVVDRHKTGGSSEKLGTYGVPIEMVRLGPSASNKQPWRIIKDKNSYHFYLCRTKGYGSVNFDVQKNDLGIAM